MEYHLTRGLRLKAETEYKSLYTWAINELDENGRVVGRDQIPWAWSLYFTATACSLGDTFEITSKLTEQPEIKQRQVISIQLRPGGPRDEDDVFDRTTFSMFGTDRLIKNFSLQIRPVTEATDQEGCSAWGMVSYTSADDFRKHTEDDCVLFYLFVKPETFGRYAAKIAHGLVDGITFRVGSVSGFYSEWSPDISTNKVKVLAKGKEQKIALPTGIEFEPPRLGEVGEAELFINRRLEFAKPNRR